MLLEVRDINKSFDQQPIIQNIDLHVATGEIVSLLGVSGSGKTTLFNIIAGLSKPDQGQVLLNGHNNVLKPGNVSYMLQKDLLMPYRTVLDNVILPLLLRKVPKKTARQKALALFKEFGIAGYEHEYPQELSGGMRQRAALLRTYLFDKPLTLLDEPFSALDELTKRTMHQWYIDMMHKLHLSTLLITHDIDEALVLSNRVYVIAGRPSQIVDELRLNPTRDASVAFELTPDFLTYKRRIITDLGV
ncbi:ABC transporter ATP-binding protein [Agrilactobacillus fermenti]|uniref:ABC transporter ATP-binding protein n=1 Tax=Agrilactobacillus fermenti TaxID=2586909 RepID=UPI003A5BC78F